MLVEYHLPFTRPLTIAAEMRPGVRLWTDPPAAITTVSRRSDSAAFDHTSQQTLLPRAVIFQRRQTIRGGHSCEGGEQFRLSGWRAGRNRVVGGVEKDHAAEQLGK